MAGSIFRESVLNLTSVGSIQNGAQALLPLGSSATSFNFDFVGSDQVRIVLSYG
jgi:hypothetical protein